MHQYGRLLIRFTSCARSFSGKSRTLSKAFCKRYKPVIVAGSPDAPTETHNQKINKKKRKIKSRKERKTSSMRQKVRGNWAVNAISFLHSPFHPKYPQPFTVATRVAVKSWNCILAYFSLPYVSLKASGINKRLVNRKLPGSQSESRRCCGINQGL